MHRIDTVRDAHAWLRWMTGRSLDAAASLGEADFRREFPIGIGSVHKTFAHLVGAERIWIGVLEGDAAVSMPDPATLADAAAIRAAFGDVRARWDRYLARLDERELGRVVVRERDGKQYRQTVADACMQVPTHALYHNAQLSFMFRSMGHALPDSSWILWGRERISVAGG